LLNSLSTRRGSLHGTPELAIAEIEDLINKHKNNIYENGSHLIRLKYGKLQYIRGLAYYNLSHCDKNYYNLVKSIEAFTEASRNTNSDSPNYNDINNNIGVAYLDLCRIVNTDGNIKNATFFFNEYANRTSERDSTDYAKYLNNIGTTHRYLSEVRDTNNNIKKSIKEYEEALRIYENIGLSNSDKNIKLQHWSNKE